MIKNDKTVYISRWNDGYRIGLSSLSESAFYAFDNDPNSVEWIENHQCFAKSSVWADKMDAMTEAHVLSRKTNFPVKLLYANRGTFTTEIPTSTHIG